MSPNRYSLPLLTALLALVFAVPAQAQYGTGVVLQVPQATETITLDGDDNEAAWDEATEVDLTDFWNSGYYDCNGDKEVPDVVVNGKLLWDDGALYIFVRFEDYLPFYWGEPGSPWQGESIVVGVDLTHMGDDQIDPEYSGWPDNYPDLGPVAYPVTGVLGEGSDGITHNWGYTGLDPVGDGNVNGFIFIDDANFIWGVEMAIYGGEIAMGNQIGFNIGGSTASDDCAIEAGPGEDANYAYFSWQALSHGSAGGDVVNNSASYGSLDFVKVVANEPGATVAPGFALKTSGPNPFRGTTALTYELPQPGQVELALFDVLGRQVATLDGGVRAAGEHRAVFDASALPVGVYTARLVVDGAVVATRRVTHAR